MPNLDRRELEERLNEGPADWATTPPKSQIIDEVWKDVFHYVVNILIENPNIDREQMEDKIGESLFHDGFSEDIQDEIFSDEAKLNQTIEEAKKEVEFRKSGASVIENMVKIANELDEIGLGEEAEVVDTAIEEVVPKKKSQSQKDVVKALNKAGKFFSNKFYHDEYWKGVTDYLDFLRGMLDQVNVNKSEYKTSPGESPYQKDYELIIVDGPYRWLANISATEEGDRGGYMVWYRGGLRPDEGF